MFFINKIRLILNFENIALAGKSEMSVLYKTRINQIKMEGRKYISSIITACYLSVQNLVSFV